jgi:hypothetical protein
VREIFPVSIVMQRVVSQHRPIRLQPAGEHPWDAAPIVEKPRGDGDWGTFVGVVDNLLVAVIPDLPAN